MRRRGNRELELLMLLGCLACSTIADERVFFLDLENGSKGGQEAGFEAAANACVAQGAQVASGVDLHHAVLECAFSACSRGWLSGPSIGTTVCSGLHGSLRPVDVQLENVTRDVERLGVFCVKDSDAPCGQPPSFPNSHLQGKTGLDLGDELLYACNQGYKLPDGQTAFSLFCDSCGEWYGLVQHCIKDDLEGHVDYEDKFTDGHLFENPREVHQVSVGTETIDHEVAQPTSEPEHERTVMSEETENEGDSAVLATEPPVSQLSQKHMFWFPSEAFQEHEEHPVITTDSSVKSPTKDQSHMTHDKTDDHQSEVEVITVEHDPDYDHATDPPTVEPVSPSVGSTENSWLDGYPVPQGEKKGGVSTGKVEPEYGQEMETVTSSPDVEVFEDATKSLVEEVTKSLIDSSVQEHVKGVTDNPEDMKYNGVLNVKGEDRPEEKDPVRVKDGLLVTHYEESSKGLAEDGMDTHVPKETDSEVELVLKGVTEKPTTFVTFTTSSAHDDALNKQRMMYTKAYAPENVSTSQEGLDPEYTATPSGMVLEDTTPIFPDDHETHMPTPIIKVSWETDDNEHFLEHIPDHDQSEMERDGDHTLNHQEGIGEGSCAEDPCHASGRGPMVAAIIVGIAAAVVGVVLGVWCYKKRQQKSSHYQLNGTNRQTQCIELQQTV